MLAAAGFTRPTRDRAIEARIQGTWFGMMAWVALLLAGALEIAWAVGLKHTDGFTRLWPSLATVLAIASSFALMAIALKSIPFGTAYAIWAGIGVAGTAVVGMLTLEEPASALRLACVALIAAGIVGLKLADPG
jgi:quaternary ammonium compound-resistance protein SugE